MNEFGRLHDLLFEATKGLESHSSSLNGKIFHLLFTLSFDDLKSAEIGNPIEHQVIVLQHMMEIAQDENLNILVAGAIALLHDIAPVEKIRTADVALEVDDSQKNVLEQKRKQNRILHMREGSEIAYRKLLLVNEYLGSGAFRDEDIDQVCEVIRIHDNPSINIPIPKENIMAVAFREADRLWMLSEVGFFHDIQRDASKTGKQGEINQLAAYRLNHVLERYREERKLYSSEQGPFQDNDLFFRTKAGYRIYCRYLEDRRKQYNLKNFIKS
jgi:hypothetical protein